jgi:phosphatidylinositol alpha-1,6-mannosyltransferase
LNNILGRPSTSDGKSKRILILTHEFLPFKGGIATYCHEIARAAVHAGHDVTIIAPDYDQDNAADDARAPYNVTRFRGGMYNSRQFPRVLFELLKINPASYDCIHAAEWSFVLGMAVLQPLKKIPFIATMHGTDIIGFHASRLAKILHAQYALDKADKILANSNYTNKLVLKYNPGMDPKKVVTTLLGVSPYWFEKTKADPRYIFEKYGIDPSRKIILTVARLDERKGHAEVLVGLKALPAAIKDKLAYVIVGKADNDEQKKSWKI